MKMNRQDPLDTLLQNWSKSREPTAGHLEQLQKDISLKAVEWRHNTRAAKARPAWGLLLLSRLSYVTLGVLIGIVAGILLRTGPDSNIMAASDDAEGILSAVAAGQRPMNPELLFNKTQEMFAGRVRWMAETDKDMFIEMQDSDEILPDTRPVLMRLAVVSREKGGEHWKSVWNLDVVLKGEDYVQIASNGKADNYLRAWVYPMPDGNIVVDADLSLDAPVRIGSSTRNILKQGEPTEMAALITEDGEFRLYQTVQTI